METLRLEHKTSIVLRKVISVIMFLNGIFWILGHLDSLKYYHLIFGIIFILVGIAYFTNGFGSEITYILPYGDSYKVKWLNWFRPVVIKAGSIESITLSKYKVVINLIRKKSIKLNLDYYEISERGEIYKYFTNLSKEKNIALIKDF